MPNRILRDWTDSETVNTISWQAEVLFTRLIMKADDFGRFHANPKLLRSLLFPLRDGLRDADITRWIAECEKAGLIRIYVVDDEKSKDGKSFLEIGNFGQRTRAEKSKFPEPPSDFEAKKEKNDRHLSDSCQTDDRQMTAYTETETETETIIKTATAVERQQASVSVIIPYPKTPEEVIKEAEKICYIMDRDTAIKFIADYSATGWIYKRQKITDWRALLPAWKVNQYNFKPQKGGSQRGNYKHVSTNPADFDESDDGSGF